MHYYDKNHFIQVLEQRLQQKTTLENIDVNSMRISYSLNDLLAKANSQMTSFKDEYMSVEHVIMALFEINENWVKDLLNQEGMNKKDTKKDIFYAQDGKVDTDFMHKEMGSHFFIDNKDYAATSLTLSNSSSLTLVLPKEGKDIRRMMEQKEFLQELLKDDTEGADFGIVKLSLPKFKVHSKLQLADTLKAMGVTSLFDIAAELNGITNEKPFFVSDIQQETSIALNEEGIEASAYTMIGATGAANMEHPKVLDLNLNRPFLYVISTRMDGVELPLFIGVCSNPAS